MPHFLKIIRLYMYIFQTLNLLKPAKAETLFSNIYKVVKHLTKESYKTSVLFAL